MMDKEFYTFEEVKDELIGKCGTPSRDEYEAEIEAHLIGQHIRRLFNTGSTTCPPRRRVLLMESENLIAFLLVVSDFFINLRPE